MNVHVEVAPQALWQIPIPGTGYSFPVTNSFLMMVVIMALLTIGGAIIARRATLIPSHSQSIFEMITEFILGLVESTAGRRLGRSIFPLIGGMFIFIIFANWVTIWPFMGTVGLKHMVDGHESIIPFVRPPTSDLNMTLAMAIISYFAFQYLGVKAHGFKGRLKHMATPVFIFPIEVISEFSRIISLSFRLFGNVFAGDVLLTVMFAIGNAIKITVIGFAVPVVFIFLELLFGSIQALVFALLTLIYISLAAAGAHDDEHAEHAEAAGETLGPVPAAAGGD